jgi:inosose dehydratase
MNDLSEEDQNMIKIANAPCSWGVIENTEGERHTYDVVLDQMAEAGYSGTELGDWGFMPNDPDTLRQVLEDRNLQLVGSWVSIRLYDPEYIEAGIIAAVRTAELLVAVAGPQAIIVIGDDHSTVPARHDNTGRIKMEHELSEAQWEVYVSGAERAAKAIQHETGLRVGLHHHGATYVETPAEIEKFLAMSNPATIGLVFDTGHYALGGGNPETGLRKYANRIIHIHFKDFNPAIVAKAERNGWGYQQLIGQGVFPELGKGTVNFPEVYKVLRDIAYEGWIVVEQDVLPGMGTPRASAVHNRNFLRQLGI